MVNRAWYLAILLLAGLQVALGDPPRNDGDHAVSNAPLASPKADAAAPPGSTWSKDFLSAETEPVDSGEDGQLCNKPGVIGYADYLCWKARRQGLDYAAIVNPLTFDPLATTSLEFARESGIRAGIGYRFANGCDLTWNYTDFRSADHDFVTKGAGGTTDLLATRSVLTTTPVNSVQADASLHLAINDFEANWRSDLNDAVGFRAFGGLRLATIDQQFTSVYTLGGGGVPQITGTIQLPNDMDAQGLRFGAEFQWQAARQVRVFGRAAQSILLADFRTRQTETSSAQGVLIDLPQRVTQVVPVVEAAAGIAWSRGPIEVDAGYEMSDWFNMADFNRKSQGLLIDGFFVRLALMR